MEFDEFQAWFQDEELVACPSCRRPAALTIQHTPALLCFACGLVRWQGGETSLTELQRPTTGTA